VTGHERIIAIRRKGLKPPAVFVTDLPAYEETSDIHIAAADVPEALDLRFMTGLLVHVSVVDDSNGRRIAKACADASKRCICAYHLPGERLAHHITDTEENREWKF
jgi:hypothetical protein